MEDSSRPAEKSYLRARRRSGVALSLHATQLPSPHLPPKLEIPQDREPGQVGAGGSLTRACYCVVRGANTKKEGVRVKG